MDFGTQANFLEQDRLGEEKMYFNFFFFFVNMFTSSDLDHCGRREHEDFYLNGGAEFSTTKQH